MINESMNKIIDGLHLNESISDIKRYDKSIDFLEGYLNKKAKKDKYFKGYRDFRFMVLTDRYYGIRMSMYYNVEFGDVIHEMGTDGNLYIGFPIKGVELEMDSDGLITDIIVNSYYFGDKETEDKLAKDLGIDTGEYISDRSIILGTKPFNTLKAGMEDICESKATVKLKDGQFPKLKNRNMVPIFIVQFDKGKIDYCYVKNTSTYRKNRNTKPIKDLKYTGFTDNNNVKYSVKWFDLEIDSRVINYVDN